MRAPGRFLAAGRDCDVFEYAPGLVLRRSRHGRSMAREARVMEYVRQHGYPVPAVEEVCDDGTTLVMQRIDGPSMVGAIERAPWTVRRQASTLAELHRRLHCIAAPGFVPAAPIGHGDRMLHLDLHPLNVIIGSAGPVVIDWTNAAGGDPALDIGIASLLIGAGDIPSAAWKRPFAACVRKTLLRTFLAEAADPSATAYLRDLVEWKSQDTNMSAAEVGRMKRMLDDVNLR